MYQLTHLTLKANEMLRSQTDEMNELYLCGECHYAFDRRLLDITQDGIIQVVELDGKLMKAYKRLHKTKPMRPWFANLDKTVKRKYRILHGKPVPW